MKGNGVQSCSTSRPHLRELLPRSLFCSSSATRMKRPFYFSTTSVPPFSPRRSCTSRPYAINQLIRLAKMMERKMVEMAVAQTRGFWRRSTRRGRSYSI